MPFWLPALLVAPFVGSFVGVLIRRLPDGRPVMLARSACERCARVLSPAELVPLASYAMLRGRCRGCGAPIGLFHPAAELACLGVALWAAATALDGADLWLRCALGWALLALAWIDLRSFALPDVLTLPLLLAGLAAAAWLAPEDLADRALAAALGYTVFRAVSLSYRAWRGREGLGVGDAKLLAASGAWVGLAALPWVVLLAAGAGIVFALGMQLRDRRWQPTAMIPFGPFLALGTWLIALYGLPPDALADWLG